MAYATILVRFFLFFLSPGRLIKKVGRDVTDGHFVYIYSAIFRHQTDLFYCAQDIGAVVCPFIYHYATHTANGFRAVRHIWNHCVAERTCRFVKPCLHERLLAYLSPDTVTGDDGRQQPDTRNDID